MKNGALVAVMCLLLVLACGVAWYVWSALDGVSMSIHGYIALGLGVILSLLVGGGLMALVFFSARRGYDDIEGSTDNRKSRQPD